MVICRTDGTLAPCYPMRECDHDWGTAGCQKFDDFKPSCSESCFSTVGYMLANYYDLRRLAGLLSLRTVRRLSGR